MDFFGLNKAEKKNEDGDDKKDDKKNDKDDDKDKKDVEVKKENDKDNETDLLNDKGGNKRIENIVLERIEFDMSQNKKQLRMKAEDKSQMELIRRWQVKIYNIYITPMKEKIDPFVQFTIGGNFSIQVYSNKAGDTKKQAEGERGFSEKTEVIENIEPLNRAPFDKNIELEMRMSYAMINAQKLMIEVWDHNSMWMNTILGYTTIGLIDVVDGDINLSFDITKASGKKKKVPSCTIEFKCIFQEIWDFKLTFVNWKAGPLVQIKKGSREEPQKRHSRVMVYMNDKRTIGGQNCAVSVISQVSTAPVWSDFEGLILFRGSHIELEQSEVILLLYDETGLFRKEIARKTVNLKGIFDFERIKTDFTLYNDKKDKYTTNVEGFVQIDHKVWYRQTGDSVSLLSKRKYLCFNIMRVENIRPAETKGIVDSFIEVEWCGQKQRTKTIKENNNPVFNETIYFELPFPEEWLVEPESYIQKLNEEFSTKNEAVFNLMIEGDDNTYDNLGIGTFHLSDIKQKGEKTQRKYFAEDLKRDKTYGCRVYSGKSKLVSAFSLSTSTHVNYETWFLDDFPETIDFGEKKKDSEKEDKIPVDFNPYYKKNKNYFLEKYQNALQAKMNKNNAYPYKERCFGDKHLQVVDQYKNRHYLPYYLSLITPPETIFSKEDRENNKNFHDSNLRTLDEVAHYVHCFPYNVDTPANDVWVSPDFLLKTRKGDVEDHAILCACLMMGLGEKPIDSAGPDELKDKKKDFNTNGTPTSGATPTPTSTSTPTDTPTPSSGSQGGKNKKTPKESASEFKQSAIEGYHPYENRVFVCVGRLKSFKTRHVWVMTITDDYRGVIFWDVQTGLKYELQGRIDDGNKLRKFLAGQFLDYESVKSGKVVKNIQNAIKEVEDEDSLEDISIKQDQRNYDDQKLPGPNDSYEAQIAYNNKDDNMANDNILDDLNFQMHTNFARAAKDVDAIDKETYNQNYDDRIQFRNPDGGSNSKKFNFLEDQKDQITNNLSKEDNSFSPIEEFKDHTGNRIDESKLNLPYETIDFICNRNNIWISLNNHDPKAIKYNIYEKSRWMPFFDLKDDHVCPGQDKIWRGCFDMFYSLTNFGPSFKPKMVNKMRDGLIKEMRVGITAARSGMNLQTKFKKKNEQINDNLGRYCTFLEHRALNRISQKEFNRKIEEWEIMIKQKLPKYFRMESVCVYFNFFELEIIRRNITDDLENFYKTKEKNLMFATSAGIFAYLNQVVSVRIIIAKFYKISEEELTGEELKDYKESALTANVLQEEEDSDDDDEEDTPSPNKDGELNKMNMNNPTAGSTPKDTESGKGDHAMNTTKGDTTHNLMKIGGKTPAPGNKENRL